MAEALGRHLFSDVFESYSAGTQLKDRINEDAQRLMKKLYGIDMESSGQRSKLLEDIPEMDILISMGCGVRCPDAGRGFDDDWELMDPSGKSDEEFMTVIAEIERKIRELAERIKEMD